MFTKEELLVLYAAMSIAVKDWEKLRNMGEKLPNVSDSTTFFAKRVNDGQKLTKRIEQLFDAQNDNGVN